MPCFLLVTLPYRCLSYTARPILPMLDHILPRVLSCVDRVFSQTWQRTSAQTVDRHSCNAFALRNDMFLLLLITDL